MRKNLVERHQVANLHDGLTGNAVDKLHGEFSYPPVCLYRKVCPLADLLPVCFLCGVQMVDLEGEVGIRAAQVMLLRADIFQSKGIRVGAAAQQQT